MDNKTLSALSYITFLGWIIAYFVGKDNADNFLKAHLKQSFGLAIISIGIFIVFPILYFILPTFLYPLVFILYFIVSIGVLVLSIIGIINALKDQTKPLPIVGDLFNKQFSFIDKIQQQK